METITISPLQFVAFLAAGIYFGIFITTKLIRKWLNRAQPPPSKTSKKEFIRIEITIDKEDAELSLHGIEEEMIPPLFAHFIEIINQRTSALHQAKKILGNED